MLRQLYCEAMNLLPDFIKVSAVTLAPGTYTLDEQEAERMREFMEDGDPGVTPDGSFEYTAEHAALLPRLRWKICNAVGSPIPGALEPGQIEYIRDIADAATWPVAAVNAKRPYRDMTRFKFDMADAFGLPHESGDDDMPEPALARLLALHCTTVAALRVVLLHGYANTGGTRRTL